MIDHPLLSFKDLSDDELLNKSMDIHRNIGRANMWGSSRELINQLQYMLEMIEEEKQERLIRQQFDAMQQMFAPVIESDPEFKVGKKGEEVEKKPQDKNKDNSKSYPIPSFDKEILKPK